MTAVARRVEARFSASSVISSSIKLSFAGYEVDWTMKTSSPRTFSWISTKISMSEQRHHAVDGGGGDDVGDVAPFAVEAAGGDGVLLVDLADLAAVGGLHPPAHLDALLALQRRGQLDLAGDDVLLAGRRAGGERDA